MRCSDKQVLCLFFFTRVCFLEEEGSGVVHQISSDVEVSQLQLVSWPLEAGGA